MHRKALGKGLDALFDSSYQDDITETTSAGKHILSVAINDIIPNPKQPRERIPVDSLDELKRSIEENGILEPPVVHRKGNFFELIAGERRFRAAKELNYEKIDVIVMNVESDDQVLVLSLIENIQREDLNAIEEGKAYHQIMERMKLTQEELAKVVGKNRSTVANMLRLLSLPDSIKSMVCEGQLAPGSARALVPIQDEEAQLKLARKIIAEGLSARSAETLVKRTLSHKPRVSSPKTISPVVESIRENLQRQYGTSVKIKGDDAAGKIEIAYHSKDELEGLLDALRGDSA
ncbi:ParB/RepB/Spo0J family partition protein [Candidatus Latescibacterota bacterium]